MCYTVTVVAHALYKYISSIYALKWRLFLSIKYILIGYWLDMEIYVRGLVRSNVGVTPDVAQY